MVIKNYLKNPLWGILTLRNKLCNRCRGVIYQITYHSGHNLRISRGVTIESQNIVFGQNVYVYPNVHIFGGGKLVLGDNIVIGDGTVICCANEIYIGNDTMIAAQCYITDCNHGTHQGLPMRNQTIKTKKTGIGSNCWISAGCKVLAGALVNDGTVLAAGTIITSEIPPESFIINNRDFIRKDRI